MHLHSLPSSPHLDPDRPTLVMNHGVLGRARNLGLLQRGLGPFIQTIAFDARSHGDSPRGKISYDAMANDLRENIDALGLRHVILFGHSMGGKTVMHLALTADPAFRAKISAVIVADMAPVRCASRERALIASLAAHPLPKLVNRAAIQEYLLGFTPSPAIAQWLGQNIQSGDPAAWKCGIQEITDGLENIGDWPEADSSRRFSGPALFILGGASPYVDRAGEQAIYEHFPHARLETIAGTGHWLHAEQPQIFSQIVLDFLRQERLVQIPPGE